MIDIEEIDDEYDEHGDDSSSWPRLIHLLPAISEGSAGSSCHIWMTPDLVLNVHVENAGGSRGSRVSQVNLRQAIVDLARHVSRMHGGSGSQAATQDMATRASRAVQTTGIAMAGAMMATVVTGGLWDSIKSVYRTASAPVTFVNKNVARVLQHLEPAVTIAATAVATAYGGPAAGAAASRLVGPILDSSAKTGGDPTKLFEQVKQKSGYHPTVVKAIDAAKKALTHTAVAYHATTTADDAARGDPDAMDQIDQVEQAAAEGDLNAIRVLQILTEARQASEIRW
jgi:hypothetical protein